MRNTGTSALRLLHYWWPLALGWSLTVVVARATGRVADGNGVVALLAGILAAYSLDRVLDPSAPSHPWMTRLLIVCAAAGSVACGVATWHLPLRTAALVPALGAASLCYPRLKQLPLTKTLVLPLVWTWAAMSLPFDDGSWLGWQALRQPVAFPLLLLIGAGCMLCDLKDETGDRLTGVRSLPAMLGGATTRRVVVALLLATAGLALAEHRPGIVVSAAALGLATCSPSLLATDAAGPLLVDVLLTLPGILISARIL